MVASLHLKTSTMRDIWIKWFATSEWRINIKKMMTVGIGMSILSWFLTVWIISGRFWKWIIFCPKSRIHHHCSCLTAGVELIHALYPMFSLGDKTKHFLWWWWWEILGTEMPSTSFIVRKNVNIDGKNARVQSVQRNNAEKKAKQIFEKFWILTSLKPTSLIKLNH